LAQSRAVYHEENGLWRMESHYMSNGRLYQKGSFADQKFTTREGLWEEYHENGQLAEQGFYRNGKREGLYRSWHENGRPEDSVVYHNDLRVGKSERWTEEGTVKTRYDLNEEGTGTVRSFRHADSLESEGDFLAGRREGQWIFYAPE